VAALVLAVNGGVGLWKNRRRGAVRRFWVAVFALAIAVGGGVLAYRAFSATDATPSLSAVRLAAAHAAPTASERRYAWLEKKLTHAAKHVPSTGEAADAPDVLHVTCAADKMKVASSVVQAQSDGVHVREYKTEQLSNVVWHAVVLTDVGDTPFYTFIHGLDPGKNHVVFPIPPGPMYATCHGGRSANDGFKPGGRIIDVVDPNGFWVNDRLACRDPVDADNAAIDNELGRDPERAVRNAVAGVLSSDEVIVAEYGIVHGDYVWVVVRRDGQNLARFSVSRFGGDSWGVRYGYTCPASGIGEA
jgi:hypothetical protein